MEERTNEEPESQEKALSHARHELRTPLNQIIGYSEMLKEEAEEAGHESFIPDLDKINAAGRRLVALIDDLLQPSRVEIRFAPPEAEEEAAGSISAPPGESGLSAPTLTLQEAGSEAAEGSSEPRMGVGHILVVDDNEGNRDMLARRLLKTGYDVETAEDGYRALEMIDAGKFDLILLDVIMPGISGLDVLRTIRKTRTVADLPVIVATGRNASQDVVEALAIGGNDYVTKPLDFAVVLARVETQLSLKRAKDQVEILAVDLERKNRFIQKTFGRYLSDDVVANLLESPEGARLGGEERIVTILMSDLRGFTSTCERLAPEQVVGVLNNYLGTMADVILEYGGTIDEFIGDAILAIFGAPVTGADDSERAAACALAMQLAMEKVNGMNREAGLPEIEMGIAVNTGKVVVGNIGSHKRAKYGVVGSHVNLTARIESFSTGGQILISESTHAELAEMLEVAGAIDVKAKGFHASIKAYELTGIGGRHRLRLPEKVVELRVLPRRLPLRYIVLDGKHIGDVDFAGEIFELSARGGVMRGELVAEKLSNLRMKVTGGDGKNLEGDLYAKVVSSSETAFAVRFTSVPPDVEAFFEAALKELDAGATAS